MSKEELKKLKKYLLSIRTIKEKREFLKYFNDFFDLGVDVDSHNDESVELTFKQVREMFMHV
ncbi:MAG: hypothetical protein E7168_01455 [Firmicutes bacterium]|nr:hypothetical protein [Bacillota bacterium]